MIDGLSQKKGDHDVLSQSCGENTDDTAEPIPFVALNYVVVSEQVLVVTDAICRSDSLHDLCQQAHDLWKIMSRRSPAV